MLWASVLLSIPSMYLAAGRAPSKAILVAELVFELFMTAIAVWLLVYLGRGRNWARIVMLILTMLSAAAMVFEPALQPPTIETVCAQVNTVVDVVCLVLLFRPSSSAWFARRGRTPAR